MSGLLLQVALSVCNRWFHNMVALLRDLFLLILVYARTSVICLIFTRISSRVLKYS